MSLALIAGKGQLPIQIIDSCRHQNQSLLVIDLSSTPRLDLETEKIKIRPFSLGDIGKILDMLKKHSIQQLVLAGGLDRPNLKTFSFDSTGLLWLKKLGLKAFKGDDALLKGVTELLEAEGFQIISPGDLLQTLLTPVGCLTQKAPSQEDWDIIHQGQSLLKALSPFDVGQSVIIQQGLVLGIEAIEGTEELIHRCQGLHRPGEAGVLIKMAKENQSLKVDVPSIGIQTIEQMYRCNLKGIALSAQKSQIIQQQETIQRANELGIFMVGVS